MDSGYESHNSQWQHGFMESRINLAEEYTPKEVVNIAVNTDPVVYRESDNVDVSVCTDKVQVISTGVTCKLLGVHKSVNTDPIVCRRSEKVDVSICTDKVEAISIGVTCKPSGVHKSVEAITEVKTKLSQTNYVRLVKTQCQTEPIDSIDACVGPEELANMMDTESQTEMLGFDTELETDVLNQVPAISAGEKMTQPHGVATGVFDNIDNGDIFDAHYLKSVAESEPHFVFGKPIKYIGVLQKEERVQTQPFLDEVSRMTVIICHFKTDQMSSK